MRLLGKRYCNGEMLVTQSFCVILLFACTVATVWSYCRTWEGRADGENGSSAREFLFTLHLDERTVLPQYLQAPYNISIECATRGILNGD